MNITVIYATGRKKQAGIIPQIGRKEGPADSPKCPTQSQTSDTIP